MRKAITQHGTAKDSAKVSDGYTANGESSFSRRAAHPDSVRLKGHLRTRTRPTKSHTSDIRFNEVEIERMERALLIERNPKRVAKLRKDIKIKTAFAAKLRESQITTLPGAEEYDPWSKI